MNSFLEGKILISVKVSNQTEVQKVVYYTIKKKILSSVGRRYNEKGILLRDSFFKYVKQIGQETVDNFRVPPTLPMKAIRQVYERIRLCQSTSTECFRVAPQKSTAVDLFWHTVRTARQW